MTVNSKPHGIMFHHFYDDNFSHGQGAINQNDLVDIIEYYKPDNILCASTWYQKAISNSLKDNEYCITFDDTLLCQYDIALPVLEDYGITAFWFIYSSVLNGNIEPLEIYRKFRTEHFSSINEFYTLFFEQLQLSEYKDEVNQRLKNDFSNDYLSSFSFYSENDKKFRFLRDQVLKSEKYNHIMEQMIQKKSLSLDDLAKNLWMSRQHIQHLHKQGHIIGLHSNSHPTAIASLKKIKQKHEYQSNYDDLSDITKEAPVTMSHPCNSYNHETLDILNSLDIKLGFRSNMDDECNSLLEFPREDHTNILNMIN